MKHLETRQKRKAQRNRANLEAIAFIAFVLMIGILLGSAVTAQTEESDKPEPVEARVVQYDPPPTPMPEVDVSEMETTTPRYALTVSERDIVERVVMAEAGGEGYDGQRLVAQCILNTAEAMDLRPDEVVTAPNQYASPANEASQEVKEAVSAVFDDGDMVTDEPIRWFYNDKLVYSEWHEGKRFVMYFGNHKFFAEW